MNWSIEQKNVIDTRGCSLLVSAAAGSGKTAVLVERIIGRITDPEDPVSLDQLLVMTFTRAAADEMRERIGKALADRIEQEPSNSFLKLQKAILPRARISTIDSVCQGLIRQYYQELEIDPGFRVADEGELKLMKADILETLLEEQYASADETFMDLASTFAGKGLDGRLSALIEKLAGFAESCEWPEDFLDEQRGICLAESEGRLQDLDWLKEAVHSVHMRAKEHLELLYTASRVCQTGDGPEPYLAAIEESIRYAEALSEAADYEALYQTVQEVSFSSFKKVNKAIHDPGKTAFVKDIRDGFKGYVKELQEKYLALSPDLLKEVLAGSAVINAELIRLTMVFMQRFAEAKRDKNLVDFSDMEHLALRLLYDRTEDGRVPSALADELAVEFREIMIDEYQDSNGVQEALLRALSAERFGRPDIFMVGDVKQSIYGFRQADPTLFIEKHLSYTDDGPQRKIELNKNFRSRPEVLASVNDTFDCIMRSELGGVQYDEAARLYAGADYPDSESCRTEFLMLDPGGEGEESEEEAEYRMVAQKIREMMSLRDPSAAFQVKDKESGRMRPLKYRDIAILMRAAKGHAEKLTDILSAEGIPAYFHNSTGYFTAPEVEVMLSLLAVIDNPRQDTALAAVLRSPIGAFCDDELALIRAKYQEHCSELAEEAGDMYSALLYAAGDDPHASAFLKKLNSWREIADILPVHVLLEKIYTETGYYNYMSAGPRGLIRRKNLDMLLEKAETYGSTSYHGLFQFIRYIEMLKKYDTDHGEAGAVSENDDIVRVMTIHGSKGLEFPVVFLVRMAAGSGGRDREEGILIDRGIGIGSDYTDPETNIRYPSLKKVLIREKTNREGRGEQLRLFYVAMTRAREKLVMTAARNDALEKQEAMIAAAEMAAGPDQREIPYPVQFIRQCKTWADWTIAAAARGTGSIDIKNLTAADLDESDLKIEATERTLLEELLAAGEEPFEKESDDLRELRASLQAEYRWKGETDLKPKISVSEIKMKSFEEDPNAAAAEESGSASGAPANADGTGSVQTVPEDGFREAPDYDDGAQAENRFGEDTGIWQRSRVNVSRGALAGTAYHRAMELLSYRGTAKDQMEELKQSSRMSQEEKDLVNWRAVEAFLASPLGERMTDAAREGKLFREQHFMIGLPACELDPDETSRELQLLQGIIDAYIEEDDHIILIDYKTDRVEEAEELERHYRTQLELYARALEQLTGKAVTERIIYSTFLHRSVMIR